MRRSRKPLSQRQRRKAEAREAMALASTQAEREKAAFRPILFNTHRYGPRFYRRQQEAEKRGKGGEAWRRKKHIRGEYYGRKLDALIRSGAPFGTVQIERKVMRALLS
jgi:hypothetical protein